MGQLDSTCRAPPLSFSRKSCRTFLPRDVALQVEFERQILKPVFQLIGFRSWV
jgi:hypothetical protein